MFCLVSEDRVLTEFEKGLVSRSINDGRVSNKVFELVVGVDKSDFWDIFGFNLVFGFLFF